MRTQLLPQPVVAAPWLEHVSPENAVDKTPLESFPFTIGRKETADLAIDSTRVSREHAVITRQGKKFHLHDLGSTNGTYLNGQRIQEAVLSDGDQLMFAEVEFIFNSVVPTTSRDTATQAMTPAQVVADDSVRQQIVAVRRIHEAVMRRGVRVTYQPITELSTGDHFGHEALASSGNGDTPDSRCEQWTGGVELRPAIRLRTLFRRLAVEEVAELPAGRLLIALVPAECDGAAVLKQVCQLRDLAGAAHQLVVEIPSSVVQDDAPFRALRAALRSEHVEVTYDGYAAGKTLVSEQMAIAPDYLKLAPSLLRSLRNASDRQRQVQRMIRASQDIGTLVIAIGVDGEADLDICRQLKCDLIQADPVARSAGDATKAARTTGQPLKFSR